MARSTVYNKGLTTKEKINKISKENKELIEDFLIYCESEDKSKESMKQYIPNLNVFFCWNLDFNNNKFFVDLTIKDIMKYQNYLMKLNLSSARIRSLKSVISSLSNYIEIVEIDRFPKFRNLINKIKPPANIKVREKTVLSEEEVDKMLNLLVEKGLYQMACYFALGVFSGSRKAELLQFKISYFDKKNYIEDIGMYLTPEKIRTKGEGRLGKPQAKYTLKNFQKYLDLWIEYRKNKNIESDWLFISGIGSRAKISTANYWIDIIKKITGCAIYSHCLRHFFVTMLCKNNYPADIIREIVGWSDISMISVYNDQKMEDKLRKYFNKDGVKLNIQNTSF